MATSVRQLASSAARHVQRLEWSHPEWLVLVLSAAAWGVVFAAHPDAAATTELHHASHGSVPNAEWSDAQAHWIGMVVAMMVPSTVPIARYVAFNSLRRRRYRATALFLVGYLGPWLAFGAAATMVLMWGAEFAERTATVSLAAALVVAAAWELSPTKRSCLNSCARVQGLPPDGPAADRACLRLGTRSGVYCIGACWALMLAMLMAGAVASLMMMVVATVVVTLQKIIAKPSRTARPVAAAAIAAAMLIVV